LSAPFPLGSVHTWKLKRSFMMAIPSASGRICAPSPNPFNASRIILCSICFTAVGNPEVAILLVLTSGLPVTQAQSKFDSDLTDHGPLPRTGLLARSDLRLARHPPVIREKHKVLSTRESLQLFGQVVADDVPIPPMPQPAERNSLPQRHPPSPTAQFSRIR